MSFISSNQSIEVSQKDFVHVIDVCCKDKNSVLNHKDAFFRYFGVRKKTVIYNNSNANIAVCIKPAPSSFITSYNISKHIKLRCIPIGNYEPMKLIIPPKSYRKILVPTKKFILTVCVKSRVNVQNRTLDSHTHNDKGNIIFDYAVSFFYNSSTRFVNIVNSNQKWRILYKDYPLDTSYDIFLNDNLIKNLGELPEIEYNNIGVSSS
jgi:hypothetical protein|tara:strand:- start:5886 stop:6506 length:621 start_codon:yes stop_codon:yes gene_type:complete